MELTREHLQLYLVTDPELCKAHGVVETVQAAIAGGVTMVQLRDKTASTQERVSLAQALKGVLAGANIPLVINDDIEAAILADVDGAHIGQDDTNVHQARDRLGPNKILGLSCETDVAVRSVDTGVVDYIGAGPVFVTATKADHKPPIGIDGLRRLSGLSPLPTVAIGGLNAKHRKAVLQAGADGLAVVSAICGQPDPTVAARSFFSQTSQATS